MWIGKKDYETLKEDIARLTRVADARQRIIEDARSAIAVVRESLAASEATVESLQRELSECKRVRDDYRELALRKSVAAQDDTTWQQNQALAKLALEGRPERPTADGPSFAQRLDQVFGDALSNEDLAAMHMKDKE